METGRPSSYTKEIAEKICDRISCSDKGLAHICKEPGMPSERTIMRWCKDNEAFRQQYARARVDQADFIFDQIIAIADDKSEDVVLDNEDCPSFNHEFAARSRIRIDARKWVASKLAPKKYGDNLSVDHTTNGKDIQQPPAINIYNTAPPLASNEDAID